MTALAPRTRAVILRPRAAGALAVVSALGLVAFCWPLLVEPGSGLDGATTAPWLFVALLPLLLAVVLAEVADGGMDVKSVAVLGVLAAVGAALRPLGGGAAGFEPVFFLLVLAGRALGRGFGFVLGSVTLFASALLTAGVGPWLPFQMLAAGWVGFLAGCLPPARGRAEVAVLTAYAAVAGLGYGLLDEPAAVAVRPRPGERPVLRRGRPGRARTSAASSHSPSPRRWVSTSPAP